jgi:hypothetical protein
MTGNLETGKDLFVYPCLEASNIFSALLITGAKRDSFSLRNAEFL